MNNSIDRIAIFIFLFNLVAGDLFASLHELQNLAKFEENYPLFVEDFVGNVKYRLDKAEK